MNEAFCTITTASHMHKVWALYESLRQFDANTSLHVLCIDSTDKHIESKSGLVVYSLTHIAKQPHVSELLMKYEDADRRRWVLKPVFMAYLLKQIQKIIYVDNDIYFFSPYQFLFNALDTSRMLLTPHWRCMNPLLNADYFNVNFTDGLYNAGFVAANNKALDILDAWAVMCKYKCEKNKELGLWDDQKYLDLLPVRFEGVDIVRHRGCNVAVWNKHDNKRTQSGDDVLINNTYPIVFVHFTNDTISDILEDKHGGDPLLKPYVGKYIEQLKEYNG